MAMPAPFDTLETTRELEKAGIDRSHAEAIAEGIRRAAAADREELVTKADIDALRTETKDNIDALRTETKTEIDKLRTETKAEIRILDEKISSLRFETRIMIAIVLLMASKMFGIFDAVAALF